MADIAHSVGGSVPNQNSDEITLVQRLLNKHRPAPLNSIAENGREGAELRAAIEEFQRRVVGMAKPDGRVDPDGKTLKALCADAKSPLVKSQPAKGVYSHPDADKVTLTYGIQGDGKQVPQLNSKAEQLLKSIVASCSMKGAKLTSTLRTYHDQARITITQTYKSDPSKVSMWYGKEVLEACKKHLDDIPGFAAWWEAYDRKRGSVSSLHLSNRAMDVVPDGDRTKFAAKVQELKSIAGSGVRRIIPKGVMKEPVDHVEFTFDVT